MEQEHEDFKRLLNEEDQAIAYALAGALCEEDVERFLQLYDNIPASVSPRKLGNIKEMARQVAALTRTSNYRHGPIPGKDLNYFGNNHSLQASQLSLNGPLCSNDFSAFKTPPEGHTPVDDKHFDYADEALKTLEPKSVKNQLVDLCDGHVQLDDSGISQEEGLSGVEFQQNGDLDEDAAKADDDAFHTPPEFQDNVVLPSISSDMLITSVIDRLSINAAVNSEVKNKDTENFSEDNDISLQKECDNSDVEEKLTCTGQDYSEKDSLDSSPVGSRKFTQEEDDSGISTVDENDVSRDSPTALNDTSNGFTDRKVKDKSNNRMPSDNYSQKLGNTSEKRTGASQSELKHGKTCTQESEDSVGWQTRCKRIGRRRNERESERKINYNNYDTEAYEQSERSNVRDCSRRVVRDGIKNKEKITKVERLENHMYSMPGDKFSEDYYTSRNSGAWSSRRSEDNDISEHNSSSRRSGRRGGTSAYGGKRQESRWAKNGSKDKYSETVNGKEPDLGNISIQPTVSSYRDALLKASSSKDSSQSPIFSPKGDKTEFDLNSAASYLSSVWTSVKNLHRKDPSKVFIFSDD